MFPQNAATFSFSELIYFSYFSYVWMEGTAKPVISCIFDDFSTQLKFELFSQLSKNYADLGSQISDISVLCS